MRRFAVLCLGCLFLGLALAEAQTAKKEDIAKYIKSLTAKDPQERIAACEGISAIGELKKVYATDAVDPLCAVLQKDDDAKVRLAAATALGRIEADPAKATPALIQGLRDKERGVQAASANTLGILGPGAKAAVPVLRELADQAKVEAAKAKEEQAKAKADGDKDKEKQARAKAGAAQQILQSTGGALRSITGQ
jgi:HEAT repeat protein